MSKYKEIEAPSVTWEGQPTIYNKAFARGDVRVWVSREVYSNHELRWHLSISCKHRYPTWDEIRDARYALVPNECTMAMLLPPKEEYVNLMENCFHLHEIIE